MTLNEKYVDFQNFIKKKNQHQLSFLILLQIEEKLHL